MCLIIDRNPNVKISLEMLKIACDINQHGYGISFIKTVKKDSELRILRKVDKDKKNDPKEIHELLNELKAYRVFCHLRHSTVGEVNEENSHPFFPMLKKTHGVDLGFMHNGTLYDWKPTGQDTKSDSNHFAYNFIRPLGERCAKFVGPGGVLKDHFFEWWIKKQAGYQSIFLLFDSFGNVLRVNEDKGKQYDGWWASNDYSFDTNHFRSSNKRFREWDNKRGGWINTDGTFEKVGHSVTWDGYGGLGDDSDEYYYGKDSKAEKKKDKKINWSIMTAGQRSQSWENWHKELSEKSKTTKEKEPEIQGPTNTPTLPSEKDKQVAAMGAAIIFTLETKESVLQVKQDNNNGVVAPLSNQRKTFLEETGLLDLKDVGRLTFAQLEEMCKSYPQAVAQLVVDLLHELPPRDRTGGIPKDLKDVA